MFIETCLPSGREGRSCKQKEVIKFLATEIIGQGQKKPRARFFKTWSHLSKITLKMNQVVIKWYLIWLSLRSTECTLLLNIFFCCIWRTLPLQTPNNFLLVLLVHEPLKAEINEWLQISPIVQKSSLEIWFIMFHLRMSLITFCLFCCYAKYNMFVVFDNHLILAESNISCAIHLIFWNTGQYDLIFGRL